MSPNIVGQLAAEPARSFLVGTYQGYELRIVGDKGFALEQYSILVGKRVLDIAVPVQKGTDVKTIKPCEWAPNCKVLACDISIESGEYGLQTRAKSVALIET